jgi:DNA-binding response OmpR family regulator
MRKAKIMLIDDSELLLDVISATLRDAGYEVITRSLAVGAGAHIMRERPDLVLLDVSMPLMSGAEISETIRKSSLARGTCIILHSDRPARELEELVERCGADGYIRKGADPGKLVTEVRGWIDRAASVRRTNGLPSSVYAFIACAPRTRGLLEKELVAPLPLRYSDSSAEALRHVCSAQPPALVMVGTSRVDVSCAAIYRAACRNHPSWHRRFLLIDEPPAAAPDAADLAELPRWSSERPVHELSALLARLALAR